MEEPFSPHSFYICQSIIENTLIDAAFEKAERLKKMLNLFSYQHSENLSTAMISTSNYFYGKPAKKITQDFPTQTLEKKSFKPREGRKFDCKRTSSFLTQKKMDRKSLANFNSQQKQERSNQGLIPLKMEDEQSTFEVQQDDLQQKMREIKFHQQYVRSRYAENMRQVIKKAFTFHKMDTSSTTPKLSVYDYDGSLLIPLKPDGHRLPAHYLDLQVKVQEDQTQEKVTTSKIKKQEKNKNILKFDDLDIKQNLRPVYSSFFKDISTIEWAEGVDPHSNKEECRKILGYSYSRNSHKKKIDLFKPSEKPIKIKFEQLENYKTTPKTTSLSIVEPNQNKRDQNTFFLAKQKTSKLAQANKTIQVANKKALQFLIRQDEQPQTYKKMNVFSNSKSCHEKPSQKSVTFLSMVGSKSPSVLSKKRKVEIRQ